MASEKYKPSSRISQRILEIGARLETGPTLTLIETAFHKELSDQATLFEAMSLTDIAHTLLMLESGAIPIEKGHELLGALLRLHAQPDDFEPQAAQGDLYTNREAWLAEHSQAACWLGVGRARREATTCAFLIRLREDLLDLTEGLLSATESITRRAREYRSASMPDYTYLQSAQPTTFGHYLLGFAYPMLRDLDRLQSLYARVNLSPAGCGSTNGSRVPQDRERLGALLGFEGLVAHARDAMWQADLPIETAATLTAILINLDRLAEDLQIFSTEEFGLVELDDGHARASKIMPQKKNPFALTYIRGIAGTMLGTLTSCAVLGRTPSGQPDNRLPIYGLIPRAIADTFDAVILLDEVVSRLRFDQARGRARIEHSFALATDLAEGLVIQCGMNFREAHRLVGYLVRQHLANGNLSRVTPREVMDSAIQVVGRPVEISEQALADFLNPETAIESRTTIGGAATEALDAMLSECERRCAETTAWVQNRREALQTANHTLLKIVHERLGASDSIQMPGKPCVENFGLSEFRTAIRKNCDVRPY